MEEEENQRSLTPEAKLLVRKYVIYLMTPPAILVSIAAFFIGFLIDRSAQDAARVEASDLVREAQRAVAEAEFAIRRAEQASEYTRAALDRSREAAAKSKGASQQVEIIADRVNAIVASSRQLAEADNLISELTDTLTRENGPFAKLVKAQLTSEVRAELDQLLVRVETIESGKFGSIQCTELRVLDSNENTRARLAAAEETGMLDLISPSGEAGVRLVAHRPGGSLVLKNAKSDDLVRISVEDDRGHLRWKIRPGDSWKATSP